MANVSTISFIDQRLQATLMFADRRTIRPKTVCPARWPADHYMHGHKTEGIEIGKERLFRMSSITQIVAEFDM